MSLTQKETELRAFFFETHAETIFGSEVYTAVTTKSAIFWNAVLCSPVEVR
jgi:hypothetical protein